jgi:hypothetical protein
MPSFYKEVEAESEFIDADFDITVDEFLDGCSINELERVVDLLEESGYAKKPIDLTRTSASEQFYEAALDKLHGNWNRLSKEEEDFIIKLGNKF